MLTYTAFLNESTDTPRYFITTGQGVKMYTLRVWRTEYGFGGEPYEKDYHVQTLAKDKEKAIQKAMEVTGLQREQLPITETDVDAHAAADPEKHWKFPNGKYEGSKLEEVDDYTYKMWWYDRYEGTPSYIKFWTNLQNDLIENKYLVKVTDKMKDMEDRINKLRKEHDLDEYEILFDSEYITIETKNNLKAELLSCEKSEEKREKFRKSEFVGTVGEKMKLELHLNYVGSTDTQWGSSNIYNMEDENGNIFVKFGTIGNKFFVDDKNIKATCEIKKHNDRYDHNIRMTYKQTILGRFSKY